MRKFDLFCYDKAGVPQNTYYKHRREIDNANDLKAAAAVDHVAAAYRRNRRLIDGFIQSSCIMFDVDNTDTDNAANWITYDHLRRDFPDVEFYTVTSRNHMKEKDGKAPRPKLHVYFPIDTISDKEEYAALKAITKETYTYFDKYAADTARFFYGNPNADVRHFEGKLTLTEFIKSLADMPIPPPQAVTEPPPVVETPTVEPQPEPTAAPITPPTAPGEIPAGQRNSTMSKFAFTMLIKYGDCEKSRGEFVAQSKRCTPPLSAQELGVIWEKAVQAYLVKIAGNSDYIPPREYAQWGEIQPIEVIIPPPFPFEAYPATLSAFAQSLSEYTQTAPEMACVLLLGALGAVFQKKYSVESINKNLEQLSIYAVAISPPAERKSEVIRYIIAPYLRYQDNYNHVNQKEISESEAKRKGLKAALNRAEGDTDGSEEKQEILTNAQFEYDNFKIKSPLTLLADDTTTEALISLMAKNGERMFIASGEGGVFSNMKGRYRSGDDMEIYLKGHSGDYISVHRKSREPEILRSPALSMAICLQPYIVKTLLDEENTGKGLTGRIVFAYPAARAGTRKAKTETPPDKEQYNKVILAALEKTVAMDKEKTIRLSDKADKFAEEYFYTPEKRIEDGLQNAMSWNGKAFGLSIRIAALFHAFQCYENETEPADIPIDRDTMQNAAKVAECLAAHAEKVFAGEDEKNNNALYLVRRIKRYGQKKITKTKMWGGVKRRFTTADNLNDVLQLLEEKGYVKVEKQSTGGRPAEVIRFNPALFDKALMY